MCCLPRPRHRSALALPGRPVEAPPSSLALSGRGGSGPGTGEGVPHPASPSAFLFSNTVGSKPVSVLGPGVEGGYQRTPGAPPAPPQTPIFLRLGSARGPLPCGVPEPALHTDASSPIPWPTRGLWHGLLLEEGDTLILAIFCRPALVSPSAHPGEQGGWERRGGALEGWEGTA